MDVIRLRLIVEHVVRCIVEHVVRCIVEHDVSRILDPDLVEGGSVGCGRRFGLVVRVRVNVRENLDRRRRRRLGLRVDVMRQLVVLDDLGDQLRTLRRLGDVVDLVGAVCCGGREVCGGQLDDDVRGLLLDPGERLGISHSRRVDDEIRDHGRRDDLVVDDLIVQVVLTARQHDLDVRGAADQSDPGRVRRRGVVEHTQRIVIVGIDVVLRVHGSTPSSGARARPDKISGLG